MGEAFSIYIEILPHVIENIVKILGEVSRMFGEASPMYIEILLQEVR